MGKGLDCKLAIGATQTTKQATIRFLSDGFATSAVQCPPRERV